MDSAEVFICYAHSDRRQIAGDLRWLSDLGAALWYDPGIRGGDMWRDEVAQHIDRCSIVVYFLSDASMNSQHCLREIYFAVERAKPVVPVYLENVKLTAGLELTLNRYQAIFKYRLSREDYQTLLAAALAHCIDGPSSFASVDTGTILPREKYSIGVLPFENLSSDPDQSYFCEGLAEDLLDGLSRSRDLIVKARSSSFRLRDEEQGVVSIGRRLNVTHVLRGSVRKAGSRIRVNVQLIDAGDERILWSDRYDRQLSDVFAIQDDIVSAILVALDAQLVSRRETRPEVSIEAYNAYVRGRYHQERMELSLAVQAFEHALSLEPHYADAHAAVAGAYRAIDGSMIPQGERLDLIRNHLARAIAGDPQHPVARSHQAGLLFFVDRDYQKAIYEFDRLLRQFPSTPFGGYQAVLHTIGRFDLALKLTGRTATVNPLSPQTHRDRGMHLRDLDRLDEALDAYEEAERLGVQIPHEFGEVEFRRRNSEALSMQLERVGRLFGADHRRYLITHASVLYLQKRYSAARSLLSRMEHSNEYDDKNWIKALCALRANEDDLAIEYYSLALQEGELQAFVFCQSSAVLQELFPRFYNDSARTRMLRSVALDPDSVRRLDVPPLPTWADENDR